MFTEEDQAKAWELTLKEVREEGWIEGWLEGWGEGWWKGYITEIIRIYHDESDLPDSVIRDKVKARFGLLPEEIEEFMKEALGNGVQ